MDTNRKPETQPFPSAAPGSPTTAQPAVGNLPVTATHAATEARNHTKNLRAAEDDPHGHTREQHVDLHRESRRIIETLLELQGQSAVDDERDVIDTEPARQPSNEQLRSTADPDGVGNER